MAAALAVFALALAPDRADAATINPHQSWGVWEGWGVSLCWWANVFGTRDDLADLVFTTNYTTYYGAGVPGLGMNIARYNAGACATNSIGDESMVVSPNIQTFRQMQGFWLNWYSRDPASGSWNWNVDGNQRTMLLKAKARGANKLQLFSNSPMWWMCYNHNPSGADNGASDNLQSWNYQQHAIYMATVAKYAKDNWGINFDSVEPFNEPSAHWWTATGTQEGCHFDTGTQASVIGYLRSELNNRGMTDVAVAASDESHFDTALSTWNSFSSTTRSQVGLVTVHGYQGSGGNRSGLYSAVAGKRLWNSEHGESDGTGLTLARDLNLDLHSLHPTAWCYWQPFDSGGWGLIQSNPGDNWLGPVNPKYFILAQYTRHIRPGMTIVDSGDANTVAAYDAAGRKLIIVTANFDTARTVSYSLTNFQHAAGPVRGWMTTPASNVFYWHSPTVTISNRAFSDSLAANTVKTYEIQNVYISSAAVWDSTSGTSWDTASGWLGDVLPAFGNNLDVHFHATGASSLNNNLGAANRTVRSLNFNDNADSSFTTFLSSTNGDTGTARTLILDTDGNGAAGTSAAITTTAGSSGSISLGSSLGTIQLNDNLLVTHDGTGSFFIKRPITESGGAKVLTKAGSGVLALTSANTYSGGTVISGGTLSVNTIADTGTSALGATGSLTLGGGTLSYSGAAAASTGRAVSGTGTIALPSGGLTLAGATTGGTLTKSGSGLLTLSGTGDNADLHLNVTGGQVELGKTSSGSVHAVAGVSGIASGATLRLTGTGGDQIYDGWDGSTQWGVIGLEGTLNLNGNSETVSHLQGTGGIVDGGSGTPTLRVGSQNVSSSFGGIIRNTTGTLALNKIGTGTLTLTGASANSFSGATTVSGGTIILSKTAGVNAMPGHVTIGQSNSTSSCYLQLAASNQIADAAVLTFSPPSSTHYAYFNLNGKSEAVAGINDSTGRGCIQNLESGALTANSVLTVNNSSDCSFNGYMRDTLSGTGGFTLSLVKSGPATLTLIGTNITHTGATTVNAGTLVVNGSLAGNLSVANAATLAGSGSISAPATINGRHSPGGSAVAILTHSGSLSYGATARVAWQLNSHVNSGGSGTAYDRVAAQAVTVTAGAAIDITLNAAGSVVNFTDPFWDTAKSWSILTHTSRSGNFALGSITPDAGGRVFSNYGVFSLTQSSTATALTWTPYTALESWRLQYFGTVQNTGTAADTFDANNDGEVNLLEFATGQSPFTNTKLSTPFSINGANLEYTYTRANAAIADGITFTVEWSDNLAAGSWSTAGVTQQILTDNGTVQTVKATFPAGTGRRFTRLRITTTP